MNFTELQQHAERLTIREKKLMIQHLQANLSQANNAKSVEVLNYLVALSERKFSAIKSNLAHINARLNEGYSVEQLKQIITIKCFDWKHNITMKKHLNPETLFSTSKIEKYIQEVEDVKKNPEEFKQYYEQFITQNRAKHDPLDDLNF